ncbi:cell division protein FtsQ/DivIB [Mucilaginibacter auburnensis]|uniref:Cell division protein FtsQ n=1 Tax=Mucilaginibacter auburnensis TaxID=1457233 RepID=A0A2H9VPS2_9SPHI|nr:cell division protein FtsQ [Mucilaginibacter auburnensis]PJJ80333.1 cell division protein FtsQ [Mucilaginibacter auburnensis]
MADKKRIWRNVFIGFSWLLSLGGLIVLMSFIGVKRSAVVCKAVKVYIPGSQFFIDKQEVDHILQLGNYSLVGRRMDKINMHGLENTLKANPFIEYAKVYADMDGTLMIEISQRTPILRMLNRFDQDFYIDRHGLKLPLSPNFTARVLAVSGFIDEPFSGRVDTLRTQLAKDVFKTADYIQKDELWNAQIAQVYVNADREIELVPRVGNQKILIGNADSLDVKFNNLLGFYKQALPKVGWGAYKTINIKYTNQVIGIKNTKADSLKAVAPQKTDSTTLKKDTSQIMH